MYKSTAAVRKQRDEKTWLVAVWCLFQETNQWKSVEKPRLHAGRTLSLAYRHSIMLNRRLNLSEIMSNALSFGDTFHVPINISYDYGAQFQTEKWPTRRKIKTIVCIVQYCSPFPNLSRL
jgi:hypothetical protein